MIDNCSQNVSMQELEEALGVAAAIVKLHGRAYLPIFKRLKQEYDARQSDDIMLMEAINMAKNIESLGTQNGTQNGTHQF